MDNWGRSGEEAHFATLKFRFHADSMLSDYIIKPSSLPSQDYGNSYNVMMSYPAYVLVSCLRQEMDGWVYWSVGADRNGAWVNTGSAASQ